MSSEVVTALVVGAVIVLLLVAVVVALLIRGKRERDRIAGLSPSERALHDGEIARIARLKEAKKKLALVNKEHASAVKLAERNLNQEVAARERAIRAAREAVAEAESLGFRPIGSYRGKEGAVSATESTITVPQGTFPIDGVGAAVDTAGNFSTSSRSTFTRVAGGAILFGPVGAIVGASAKKNKQHDLRELYLLIQGPQFATALTCNPDHGAQVRQFVGALSNAVQSKPGLLARREQAIPAARASLEVAVSDTSAVDARQHQLQQTRGDTARIRAAEQAVAAESSPSQLAFE